jgi:branched-chain amino acid transport system substrate-binding protein
MRRTISVVAVSVALLASGCGTRLDTAQLRDAAGSDAAPVASTSDSGAAAPLTDSGTGGLGTAPGAVAPATTAAGTTAGATTAKTDSTAGTSAASTATGGAAVSGGAAVKAAAPTADAFNNGLCVPATKAVVNIGNVGSYSGLLGAIFKQAQQGMQLWQAYANACGGGLDGHQVRVFSQDDGGDPATSLTAMKTQVEQDHVVAFVGNINVLTTQSTQHYLDEKKIPMIGNDGVDISSFSNPNIFPIVSRTELLLLGNVKLAVERGKKKFAMLYCAEVPDVCRNQFLTAYNTKLGSVGGEGVMAAPISLAQPSFTSQCQQAQAKGADSILIVADGNAIGRLAQSCHQIGYHPEFLAFSIALLDSTLSFPGLDENNLFASIGPFPWMVDNTPATKLYQNAISKYFPSGYPNGATSSLAWAAGRVIQTAALGNLGDNVTPASIYKAMYTIKNNNFGGLTQPLTYLPGKPTNPESCFFWITAKAGKFVAPDGAKCVPFK